jgi:acetyl esterase/lipase
MALGRDGIYLADMRSHRVRLLDDRTGTVITVAGGKVPRNPVIPWRFIYKKEDVIRQQGAPLAYAVAGMDAVTVRQDIRYADDALRRFDLYRPPGSGKLPLVVLVSSRNDTEVVPDTWGMFESRARVIAASGFAVVMFNHRLGLNGSIIQGSEDLDLLLRYVSEHAEDLAVDASQIRVVTYSMGSTTLADLLRKPPANLKKIVAFYPYADLRELQNWQAPGKTSQNAERYSMVTSFADGLTIPPILIIRAGKDTPLVIKGVDAFIAEALRRNVPLEVINVPDAEAGFDRQNTSVMRRVIEFLR